MAWIAGLAAAAAILLSVYVLRPDRWFGARADRPGLTALVGAVAAEPTRPVEGLLTGGFPYAPPPPIARGRPSPTSAAVLLAAAQVLKTANAGATPGSRAAAGIADLVIGDFDEAIDALEQAAREQPTGANVQSDLSAAYLARARMLNRADDWSRALASADRAIAIAARMPEAHFNRALALDGLGQDARAAEAWAAFRTLAAGLPAQSEAAGRERDRARGCRSATRLETTNEMLHFGTQRLGSERPGAHPAVGRETLNGRPRCGADGGHELLARRRKRADNGAWRSADRSAAHRCGLSAAARCVAGTRSDRPADVGARGHCESRAPRRGSGYAAGRCGKARLEKYGPMNLLNKKEDLLG